MTYFGSRAGRLAVIGLAMAAMLAMPLAASARDHHRHRGHSSHNSHHDGYRHRHHRSHSRSGRWIAQAIVAGAVAGLVNDALQPRSVYYDAPEVVYERPRTVVYESAPIYRRVVESRTVVYDDPYRTRYVRDDGYDDDDDDD